MDKKHLDYIKKEVEKVGFKLIIITILDDGYELQLKPLTADLNTLCEKNSHIRNNVSKLEAIDYKGFVATEYNIGGGLCKLLLVPKGMEEMTEFIWKYIEKYGDKRLKLVELLGIAFCVLEMAIERIPSQYANEKIEAERNFDNFSRMVF